MWFARLLLYGVGMSAAGDYVSFSDAAAEALRAVSGYEISDEDLDYMLAEFRSCRLSQTPGPLWNGWPMAGCG